MLICCVLQATMTTLLAVLIIIDFMFMDDSQFVFDPDVKES